MKHKIIYMLVLICTFSFLSSAKQTGRGTNTSCALKATHCLKPAPQKPMTKPEFVITPLAWLF